MKKKFSVEHFVGVLKQAEVGVPVAELMARTANRAAGRIGQHLSGHRARKLQCWSRNATNSGHEDNCHAEQQYRKIDDDGNFHRKHSMKDPFHQQGCPCECNRNARTTTGSTSTLTQPSG